MNLTTFSEEPVSNNELIRIFEMDAPMERKASIDEIQKPLDKSWVKKKGKGHNALSYVSGAVVTRLLNKAFQYQWSFQVVTKEVVPSLPKPYQVYDQNEKRSRNVVLTSTGAIEYATNMTDPAQYLTHQQPPVVQILGRLTIPGYGVREQWGAHVLVGGASEQESGFKSATTDAMKKCASMFGIALEIYDEVGKDIEFDTTVEKESHEEEARFAAISAENLRQQQLQEQQAAQQIAAQMQAQQTQPVPMPTPPQPTVPPVAMPTPPQPETTGVPMPTPPNIQAVPQQNVDPATLQPNIPGGVPTEENAPGIASLSWADVAPQVTLMKQQQQRLGILDDRNKLVPYIRMFLGLDDAQITELTADNITDFVQFLSQQTPGNGMSA